MFVSTGHAHCYQMILLTLYLLRIVLFLFLSSLLLQLRSVPLSRAVSFSSLPFLTISVVSLSRKLPTLCTSNRHAFCIFIVVASNSNPTKFYPPDFLSFGKFLMYSNNPLVLFSMLSCAFTLCNHSAGRVYGLIALGNLAESIQNYRYYLFPQLEVQGRTLISN